ncbi:hypothetical protein N7497_012293 [Penicillium chrysogenum]|uniref:Glucose-repressible gene protein n=1 Tax=Penicillium chrysogenum TaxID=5076 RepID=A0ABQ8WA91_PENCH|nr:hypothetical protein N7505_009811 [Penicillium chrysogenum]KAJ6137041.1 hypothetical protein N7497_012293 [Penicillium chrysogenum]
MQICVLTQTYTYIQNAANYITESVKGSGAEASKETNKNIAKDDDAKISTRATAAKDALIDKKDEKAHDTKADLNKEQAKHG